MIVYEGKEGKCQLRRRSELLVSWKVARMSVYDRKKCRCKGKDLEFGEADVGGVNNVDSKK